MPSLLGPVGSLVTGALGGEGTCLGGGSLMPTAVVSPVPTSGAWSWAGRQRCLLAQLERWPSAWALLGPEGSDRGLGMWGLHGRWPWNPECQSWALCSGWGPSPHRPQARVHRHNRAPPWASCAAHSSQAGAPRGPLPAPCEGRDLALVGGAVQGTELACRLGMAGTVSMGLAKASLLEIISPCPAELEPVRELRMAPSTGPPW